MLYLENTTVVAWKALVALLDRWERDAPSVSGRHYLNHAVQYLNVIERGVLPPDGADEEYWRTHMLRNLRLAASKILTP